MIELLQNEHRGALAEDEPGAGSVERPRGLGRLIMPGVVALMASKQAAVIGEIGAAVTPAMTTSAEPSRTISMAWPAESMPDVQPVDTMVLGPSAPAAQTTSAAKELGTK